MILVEVHPMADEDDHKQFLLSALRSASLRAKMFEIEINSIGIALKSDMVSVTTALRWVKDIGAIELIGYVPEEINGSTSAGETQV